jgi:hypothetical protein
MNHIRFGVEIEIFVAHGRQDGMTLEWIAEQLTKLGTPSIHHKGTNNDTHETTDCWKNDANLGPPPLKRYKGCAHETTDYWKIVTDSSLQGNHLNNDLCFELVSPILKGEDGLMSLRTIMENVRRLGIATNRTCGFHVHVDAEEEEESPLSNLPTLKRVAQSFASLKNAFDLLVSLSWDDHSKTDRRGN